MGKFQKYKLYIKTLSRYYLTQHTKMTLLVLLSLVVFLWMTLIVNRIMGSPVFGAERTGLVKLGGSGLGLLILFIKPVFLYIAGLIIINRLKD
ncbi:hypothetical protein HN643_00610 [Candidatus Falkowbacteria bacterium]|jgi:lipopolysaccharide export LptBFGC system permease protein LptF|nr:hypothetical protein [Candidatus Falkowbacteria bacterium]MBT5503358.1 hypothetical protein [Candidatus Falkowbacteria bacterium]MBT6573688.1 hypothetical protein [Candidatus Falkowbacteria bacterium]MBT7500159.1 hypothetical protein [Candidatus Falkowbacteria bacterium]